MFDKYGKCLYEEPLKNHTTYKVGGIAKVIVYPNSVDNLIKLLKQLKKDNEKFMVLGRGSNVIVSSKYFDGVVINLEELDYYSIQDNIITAGAGTSIIKLAIISARENLSGLEFAAGIPGSLGGGIFMNAGAYKSAFSDIIQSVKYLDKDFNIKTINKEDINFGYRESIFKHNKDMIVIEATMKFSQKPYEEIKDIIDDRKKRRVESQPLEYPSAGSVFRNPEEIPAGKLIEDLGLKGYQIGGAKVSEKHANFIINAGDATGEDIRDLINYIKDKVKKEANIDLILEQELINF